MKTSARGLDLIKRCEGFAARPYRCPAGKLTIGYGHIVRRGERFDPPITGEQATELLRADVESAERAVEAAVTAPLTQPQFDALVSFVFNVGGAAFRGSRLARHLNAGRFEAAADEFLCWVLAAGRRLPGLERRREAERALFLEEAP